MVIAILADWMANSSPPWSAYRSLMDCFLVALDKRSGVCLMGLGEMLLWSLATIVMREARYQVNMAYDNLQLCKGPKAGIEGATQAVGNR